MLVHPPGIRRDRLRTRDGSPGRGGDHVDQEPGSTRGLEGNNVNVFHVNNSDKVVGFHRWMNGGAGDDVVVIANFSARAFDSYQIGLPRGGAWHVRLNSDWNGYASDFGNHASDDVSAQGGGKDGLGFSGSVGIGAYSVIILSQ